jgi:hypothetical protein
MLSIGKFEKQQERLIVVARFGFSCSLFATFGAKILKNTNIGGNLIMKIITRVVVLTLVLSAMNFGAGLLSGPGPMPGGEPPVHANL